MKVNLKKMYIVFKPTKHSEMADVFSSRPITIQGLQNQFLGGLQPEEIHSIHTTKSEAQKVANTIWRKKMEKKAQKPVTKGYAIFSDAVLAEHKYIIDSPPKIIYRTRKAAQKEVDRERRSIGGNPGLKIMKYDQSKRRK